MIKNETMLVSLPAEVHSFTGAFSEIELDPEQISNENMVGEMDDVEKILYTLFDRKKMETFPIIKAICGKEPNKMLTVADQKWFNEQIGAKASGPQLYALGMLKEAAENFNRLMWKSIRTRFPSAIAIRPGWKIVSGEKSEMNEIQSGPGVFYKKNGKFVQVK